MDNIAILIPAYNPDSKLIKLLKDLSSTKFRKIVIVDDGSLKDCDPVFRDAANFENVILLKHTVNTGQGGALKTGMEYIYQNFPDIAGIVCADADGQHAPKDILNIASSLISHPDSLILGVRSFGKEVPFRSRFGNIITSHVLKMIFGLDVSDSQTGLRGIPLGHIPTVLGILYNRFEFNTEVLIVTQRAKVNIVQIPIETIYIEGNKSSHFNPLLDSMKIYFALFRYSFASVITVMADYAVFILAFNHFRDIFTSNYLARFVALFINYLLVSRIVFYSKEKVLRTFPKYVLLVITSGFISSSVIFFLSSTVHPNIVVAKMIAESLMFLPNFIIQKDLVFVTKKAA